MLPIEQPTTFGLVAMHHQVVEQLMFARGQAGWLLTLQLPH